MQSAAVVSMYPQYDQQTTRPVRSGSGVIAAFATMLFLLAVPGPAAAEDERMPDRFMLRFGDYNIRNASTIARLDANNLPVGTYVDFHDTLGGDDRTTVFRLDGLYRFNDRHALGFSWYSLNFKGSSVLGQDIVWDGVTYPISTQVDSKLEFDVYKVNYQYSLYHNKEVELGASFGLHIMKTFAGINAIGINQSASESVTAPLPVFGLFADHNFTPRLSVFYTYQFFFINYQDKIRGGLSDFLMGLEYRLFRHIAVGAAYNRFGLHVKAKGDNTTLYLDSNWNGVMLYGAIYF